MKKRDVRVSAEAEKDLFELWRYVADTDSAQKADALIDKLEALCSSLEILPNKGHAPKELRRIEVLDFLEIHFKPYRVICEFDSKSVLIHAVLDGRRDMESLLRHRLLR